MKTEGEYGPKMRALPTPRMQRFVLALLEQGKRNQTAAYIAAGYAGKSRNALQANACLLVHDTRIQEALQEEAGRRTKDLLPLALHTIEAIVADPQHKDAAKVALSIMDRAGLHSMTEQKVTVGLANDTEMLQRIRFLAERNGIPLAQLIGARHAKLIEGTAVGLTPMDDDEQY